MENQELSPGQILKHWLRVDSSALLVNCSKCGKVGVESKNRIIHKAKLDPIKKYGNAAGLRSMTFCLVST